MAKAWSPIDAFISNQVRNLSQFFFFFCERLEATDPKVRNGRSVEIVDGTRVERLVCL
jgi:hypothetical protein